MSHWAESGGSGSERTREASGTGELRLVESEGLTGLRSGWLFQKRIEQTDDKKGLFLGGGSGHHTRDVDLPVGYIQIFHNMFYDVLRIYYYVFCLWTSGKKSWFLKYMFSDVLTHSKADRRPKIRTSHLKPYIRIERNCFNLFAQLGRFFRRQTC